MSTSTGVSLKLASLYARSRSLMSLTRGGSTQGFRLARIVIVRRGAISSYVVVMAVVRCLLKLSTETESSGLRKHSPRYSFKGCRCLFKVAFSVIGQILASCRDLNTKGGGRGRVNSILSLIKS